MNEAENSARKLVVLGTSHQFQGEKFLLPIDDKCYRAMVEQLIKVHNVDFVFEEASGLAPSYAELIAKHRPKPIGYLDVDPSRAERVQHGLAEETGASYLVGSLWRTPPCVGRTEYVDEHSAREQLWLNRIRSQNFTVALMICGCAHGLSFSFRLKDAGFEIEDCVSYMPYDKLCGNLART
jgi:hypothetical protein